MELQELQRLTVVKLREEALQHEGITGVNGMNKDQLIEALAPVFGIDLEAATRALKERLAIDKGLLKKEIHSLKNQRDAALTDHDTEASAQARKDIKKRKRSLRRMLKTAKA
jgi:hypothetical protein